MSYALQEPCQTGKMAEFCGFFRFAIQHDYYNPRDVGIFR